MGSANEPTSLNMSPILKIPRLPEKISCAYTSKFKTKMILNGSFSTINSWTSWNRVQKLKTDNGYFKFRRIKAHQGQLNPDHPDYKGSSYNLLVELETGEVTYETLTQMSMDDPVSCAVFGKKHNLLDKSGWKRLRRFTKTSERLIRAIKQSRLHQVRAAIWYQYGFEVSRDYKDALRIDKAKWKLQVARGN